MTTHDDTEEPSGGMPIDERDSDDRPKGPMSPTDDDPTEPEGAMPIDERDSDDRPKGPMSP